jgi:hypothetical protein
MTTLALTNWKYDKSLYHNIQSGPQRTGSNLDLTDTYIFVEGQYEWAPGQIQNYTGVNDQGADFGIITPGPPNAEAAIFAAPPVTTIAVAIFNPGTGNRFYFNGVERPVLAVVRNGTYVFDQSDVTNTLNDIAFSTTPDGTFGGGVEYTVGVTRSGTPGTAGATVTLVVASDAPTELYYYSQDTAGYGNEIQVPPVPITKIWGYSTAWRAVPPVVPGYWTNYSDYYQQPSGVLSVYEGYRRQGLFGTANSTVQAAFGPNPGVKDIGAFTYYGAAVPDNQFYSPFDTPEGNTAAQGITGGPGTYERVKFPILTNPTNDDSGSRAAWQYNQPVYCQTFVEVVRSDVPGATGNVVRNMYRGRSSRYVPNYGSTYGVLGEGVRNVIRTFSASVNSSNQKGI